MEAPRRLRFPKAARLRTPKEFRAVRAARRGVRDHVLDIAFRRNGLPLTRLGLAITIRGIGAVHRNRVKRVLREIFRLRRPDLPTGLDLVVVARDPAAAGDFAVAAKSFDALVRRIAEVAAR